MSSTSVWYLLVDSNGQPYEKTSADLVELPSTTCVVAQFRKAVKSESFSILDGFTSSQLIVYKNKESFEKRNTRFEQEREEPLEVDAVVDGLGTTKNDALIVVVPPLDKSVTVGPSLNDSMDVDQSRTQTNGKLNSLARHHLHPKQVFEESENNNYIMDVALETNSSSSSEVLSLPDIIENLQSKSPTIEQVNILSTLQFLNLDGFASDIPCFKDSRPSLLFWRLGTLNSTPQLRDVILDRNLTVMIGTSGTGKTRQIFDVLSTLYGIYFTVSDTRIPGSIDFTYMMKKLERYMNEQNQRQNQQTLNRFCKCILGARLYLFQYCHQNISSFTPEKWLLFQLRYNFGPIINEFLCLSDHDLDHQLKTLLSFIKLKNQCQKYVPVFLDEAQVTIKRYENHFLSSDGERGKPLYYGLAVAFTEMEDVSFTSSGTGLRLNEAEAILLSRASKPGVAIEFIVANVFETHQQMNCYINDICPLLILTEQESEWFFGRVRFLTTYLEYRLENMQRSETVYEYVESITQDNGNDVSLARIFKTEKFDKLSLRTQVYNVMNECVLHYIYFGKPMTVTVKEAWLFEESFGILHKDMSLFISIDEPLVLKAARNLVFGVSNCEKFGSETVHVLLNHLESRIARTSVPSSQGHAWENYIAVRLFEICKNDCRTLFGIQGNIFESKGLLVNHTPTTLFTTHENCSLTEFLTNPRTSFYFPDRFAGPDIVFLVQFGKVKIPVFVQCKLRVEVSCSAGLRTTNPIYFYCNRSTWKPLKEWVNTRNEVLHVISTLFKHHLGILIAYPKEWKMSISSKKSDRFEQVFDKKNANVLLDETHRSLLDYLKRTQVQW